MPSEAGISFFSFFNIINIREDRLTYFLRINRILTLNHKYPSKLLMNFGPKFTFTLISNKKQTLFFNLLDLIR